MTAVAHASPTQLRRLAIVPVGSPRRSASTAAVYRRRRIGALVVLTSFVVALVLGLHGLLASFGGGPLTASERPGDAADVYVVQPGDTFWAIATRLHPGDDPRPLVADLVAAHGSATLQAGERIRLPNRA